jgi:cytochrome P450
MDRADDDPLKLTPELVKHYAEHFDHHDPRFAQDPHPVYHAMRSKCPITWSDNYGGFWAVTGYEEAREVWQHPELFSTAPSVSVPAGLGHHRPMLPLEVDPPLHGKYRARLNKAFSPKRVAALEPEIYATCDRLIDGFINKGECEFVTDLAQPLPTEIFVKVFGIPQDESHNFRDWNHTILHGQFDDPTGDARNRAGAAARDRLTELIAERKRVRRDDVLSLLVDSQFEGESLTDEEMIDIAFLLFLAGLDTVQGATGFMFSYLARHPGHRDRLVREPALIPDAMEELLRFETINTSGRNVTQDMDYRGVTMKKGDPLVIVNRAANRDPKAYPNPDEVDFDRDGNPPLTFATGPHRCLGSHLARSEMRIALERMLARIPDFRLKPGETVRLQGGNVAGVASLPLVWDTRE